MPRASSIHDVDTNTSRNPECESRAGIYAMREIACHPGDGLIRVAYANRAEAQAVAA
jgi:hypothetical protein